MAENRRAKKISNMPSVHGEIGSRSIKAANVAEKTETIARHAGARLAAAKSSGTLDAIIVAPAEANFATDILTTNPDDLRALASANVNVIAL